MKPRQAFKKPIIPRLKLFDLKRELQEKMNPKLPEVKEVKLEKIGGGTIFINNGVNKK